MSENSSDSDSSCGWTVINHEGSDVEALASEHEGPSDPAELGSEESVTLVPEEQAEEPVGLQVFVPVAESGQNDASSVARQGGPPSESLGPAAEGEGEPLPEEGSCVGTVSDDSDIVTLETPKTEELRSPEEAPEGGGEEEEEEEEEAPVPEEFNMGTSSSSHYAFCRPEAGFPPPLSGEESSSDETSHGSGPALRRRRAKKRPASSSESEEAPPGEQGPEPPGKRHFSSGLNRCIVLALVVAVSMGFGHFYGLLDGTMQIQNRQLVVEKTPEEELSDGKGHLPHCRQGQEPRGRCQLLKEGLATCLPSTDVEKTSFASPQWSLASENRHLRESLEREEQALAALQEELRELREQIRHLEGRKEAAEGRKRKANPEEEERHRRQSFVQQKKALFTEAQMLRRELDRERQLTAALREELDRLSSRQAEPAVAAEGPVGESQEMAALRGRLEELEKKLSFEEQRSDLWEKLYVEVKGHAEKPAKKGAGKAKKRAKASFFGSVKETFDAMKNSTKEFVRHHKEKIKQAKEAVKENLRKFSDSVKSTFRHFKDTTRDIFEEREKRRHGNPGGEGPPRGGKAGPHKPRPPYRAPGGQGEGRPPSRGPQEPAERGRKHQALLKGCAGIFDCAHQEFLSLFDRVLDPIRADEFSQLVHRYLQQEVASFHHWRELDGFLSQFFRNGVFIHDQMLFTDFVSDVKDYLDGLKEYQRDRGRRAFEDMDRHIYTYYFRHDHAPRQGPRQPPPRRASSSPHQDRPSPKNQPHHRKEREGKWPKQGRSNGRHVANVEIEWGQLPLDPKY